MTTTQVNVLLEGGPQDFPERLRARAVPTLEPKIKVPHGAGYEHFERTEEAADDVVIYRWTARTWIAE